MTCSTPRRNPARTPANTLSHGKTRPLVVTGALLLYAMLAGGCAPERPESVPADARSVAKQSGTNPLNFTAPEDGSAYVYDRSSQKMVYSGRLQRGETLEIDPRRNGVRIDGRKVVEAKLRDLNEYQVWFDAEPEAVTAAAPVIVQTPPPPAAAPRSTIHINTSPAPASSTRPPTTTTTTTTSTTTRTGTSTSTPGSTSSSGTSSPSATGTGSQSPSGPGSSTPGATGSPATPPPAAPDSDSPTAPKADSPTPAEPDRN